MSSHRKRTRKYSALRGLLALVGIGGLIGATPPAGASVEIARNVLEARVFAMRAAIHDDAAKTDPLAAPDRTLAQWYNWNNWNNWPNWANWGNWFNR